LSIFRPRKGFDPTLPDYVAKDVMDALLDAMEQGLPYESDEDRKDISDATVDPLP
jgi:hypothetical protein